MAARLLLQEDGDVILHLRVHSAPIGRVARAVKRRRFVSIQRQLGPMFSIAPSGDVDIFMPGWRRALPLRREQIPAFSAALESLCLPANAGYESFSGPPSSTCGSDRRA